MATYPTASEIRGFASSLSTPDPSPFFDRVSANVEWDVLGTHPAAGHFTTLGRHDMSPSPMYLDCILTVPIPDAWKKGALDVVNAVLRDPLKLELLNVFGGGDQEWATIELKADSVCKNGELGVLRRWLTWTMTQKLAGSACPGIRISR